MTNDNLEYYRDAATSVPRRSSTLCRATQHADQGLSLTLFFLAEASTRDINRAQIYAWKKGIKTIYYIRLRQQALEGTEVEGCVSVRCKSGGARPRPSVASPEVFCKDEGRGPKLLRLSV